jgi:heavy metal sensor kinase
MSIRLRLTVWYTVVLILMLLAFAVAVYAGGIVVLRQNVDRDLIVRARLLAEDVARGQEPVALGTAYRVLSPDGLVLSASGGPLQRAPVNQAALAAAQRGQIYRENVPAGALGAAAIAGAIGSPPLQVRMMTVPIGRPPTMIVQVGELARDERRFTSVLLVALLGVLVLGLPLAALGGWWLAGRALAPIRAMAQTAQRIEDTSLSERLPQPRVRDELGVLAATFNELLDRLQAAFLRERRFIADVSHDLRTPLALAKSTIGVALNRTRTVDELRTALTEVDGQVDRMSKLLDATLFLSHADAKQLRRHYQPVDLSELLTDLYETTAPYAEEERNQKLLCEVVAGLRVRGDRDQLTRLFLNLLDNAMQYTPANGTVWLRASRTNGQLQIQIADTGAGIAPEDLPRVFDRFYRVDDARGNADSHHHGLGLSIAQAIAHAHDGNIRATSQLGKGSTFTVTLPALTA